MIVINVSDESITENDRNNWLSYWKHFSQEEYCYCSETNCMQKHHHGVLVKHISHSSEKLFVVPLCKEHSYGYQGQLEIDERVEIIPAELCM